MKILNYAIVIGVALMLISLWNNDMAEKRRIDKDKLDFQKQQYADTQADKEKQEADNRYKAWQLSDCLAAADANYSANFKSECKARYLPEDCSLPIVNANLIDNWKKSDKEECFRKYK